ncbi:MAG: YfcE family phosphodiesterase [Nitrososphaerota archaeon]|jgi:putative phosphoesterase|nr:YfcE family phosphodiesterase [Nitrososphaerota archaeon]
MNTQPTFQPCTVNSSYCRFGAQTLLKLLDGYNDLIVGVIDNPDIEYVHKTRVGSRRLSAVLTLFEGCFSKKEYTTWCRDIKKVTRLLSQARDLDVQISLVEGYLKKLDTVTDKTGLNALLKDHKNRRKNIQATVVNGLEELKAAQTLAKIREHCEDLTAQQNDYANIDSGQVLQRAHRYISLRLNDFLSMKPYVYLENETLHHHQMRIYAKKLRYTLECFASLYENKLESEIQRIKDFQDTLGEMHDCDVWLGYITPFSRKLQERAKLTIAKKPTRMVSDKSLQIFEAYIQDRRKKYYRQFVDCWNQSMKDRLFDQFTDKSHRGIQAALPEKTRQSLTNPNVKLAVLSDVHANLQALQKVLQDAKIRGAEIFVNAGDSVGFGACPNEVVSLLCEKEVLSIAGNYDVAVIENRSDAKNQKKTAFKYTKKSLSKASKNYLTLLPRELRLEAGGKRLLIVHGSPKSIDEHLYSDTPPEQMQSLAKIADADIVVVGHSHIQFQREVNGTVFVNPGSTGRPSDGNPQTAYALLSFNPFKVELIRLPYDVENAAYALRKCGLPESFAQMLFRGVSIDAVVKDDKVKKAELKTNCGAAVAACERFSGGLQSDIKHYQQVTRLALALFDELVGVHKLGKQERCWLECAAVLHDVGLSKDGGPHHKESMQLILNSTQLPFPSKERRIIASIARYHRKGLPKPKHYNLASLDHKSVHSICVLAALLRLADSLDYRHKSCVKTLCVMVSAKKVTVECLAEVDLLLELQVFNKKKDLFEKIFKKKVVLIWNQQ